MRIGIVYSETSAKLAYSPDIYSKLFLEAQSQAMIAGIPFDILSEADLTDINIVRQYDTLLFPGFQATSADKLDPIVSTLTTAAQTYHVGMVAQGDFLTTDQNGQAATYNWMESILGVQRDGGSSNATYTVVADAGHPVMSGYAQLETLGSYHLAYSNYRQINGTGTTLAEIVVDGQRVPGIIASETNGRNVHFGTDGIMGDNNVLSQALRWSVLGEQSGVTLDMSRQSSIVAARVDMDLSSRLSYVSPVDASGAALPGVYDKMIPIIEQWKHDYNFVGTFAINIGNIPSLGITTNWAVSGPVYQKLLALGNEIANHSYTHPSNTSVLTPAQIQFEFQTSRDIIEQNLGIQVPGATLPGDPETIEAARAVGQFSDYVSGGTVGLGAGYLDAIGYRTPQDQGFTYLSPNVASEFSQIGFLNKSIAESEAFWSQEWTNITSHANTPVAIWSIHDYGIAEWPLSPGEPSIYTTQMYTNFWSRAFNAGAEFVTLEDLSNRISAQQRAHVSTHTAGHTISASVVPDASAPDLGKFALSLANSNNQVIKNVLNYYAYDNDSVFVPKDGGNFEITLGATQDDVTHIHLLPSRADLLSVSGDGSSLNFILDGEGRAVVHHKHSETKQIAIVGALDAPIQSDEIGVTFHTAGQHSVSISDGGTVPDGIEGVIQYLDSNDVGYASLYHFSDNSSWLQFRDVSGGGAWSDFTDYFGTSNQLMAQLVHQRDGTGWTQFWDASGGAAWTEYTSYTNTSGQQYAQLVHERDGSGWIQFWDTKDEAAWAEYANYTDTQGRKNAEYILNDDGSVVRAFWDTNNQFDWATFTKITDAAGQITSYYGTNHDGSSWIIV
jgi:hypothetical protein